jgi:hypothetical protein
MSLNRWLLRDRVLGAVAAAVFVAIVLYQAPWSPAASVHFHDLVGAPPFDERPGGYTLQDVRLAFDRLGAQGLAGYKAYRALDMLFPWLLGALVSGVMLRLDAARATMWPWLAATADTAENVALVAMLATRDAPSPELVQWASGLTQLKFALYGIMLAMLLAVGARHAWRRRAALR